jgi:hypothetical protein
MHESSRGPKWWASGLALTDPVAERESRAEVRPCDISCATEIIWWESSGMHEVDDLITRIMVYFAALAGLSLLWTRVYRDKGQGAIPNSNSLHTKVFLRFLTLVSPHPPDSTNEKADVTAQLLGLHMTGSSHFRCAQLSCVATLEIMRADPPRSLHRATFGTHARKRKIPIARSRSGNKMW